MKLEINLDAYKELASKLFGVDYEKVTEEQKDMAKRHYHSLYYQSNMKRFGLKL